MLVYQNSGFGLEHKNAVVSPMKPNQPYFATIEDNFPFKSLFTK